MKRALLVAAVCAMAFAPQFARAEGAESAASLAARIEKLAPRNAAQINEDTLESLLENGQSLQEAVQLLEVIPAKARPAEILSQVRLLLQLKQSIDDSLERMYSIRGELVEIQPEPLRRERAVQFLRITSRLTDLSGRIRFAQVEAFAEAERRLRQNAASVNQLVDDFVSARSSAGANVMAKYLSAADDTDAPEVDPAIQERVLKLIRVTRLNSSLPQVAQFFRESKSPRLSLLAAETIRDIGLPQTPRPGSDKLDLPTAPIVPAEFARLAAAIDAAALTPDEASRREELAKWSLALATSGIENNEYRIGDITVKPGDWLLMRNPSPYNLFSNVAPGLFTHVGVVTTEKGTDGLTRMVIVDLPEHGSRMPATNVEVFLIRTLNYLFLRHPDTKIAAAMGDAARTTIGAETQFDLTFQSEPVLKMKGVPLAGKRIHTYCAGFLLLCALQTEAPRDDFFPIRETVAGGNTAKNLEKLGLSIGKDFLSPTGALFSPKLEIVGRREPMYDPKRQVEEAVFDHFARQMAQGTISPSPGLFDSLRQRMAVAAEGNPLLKRALADVANVSEHMDLIAAAKAAGVVETLDDVAFDSSANMLDARDVILSKAGGFDLEDADSAESRKYFQKLRERHADLIALYEDGKLPVAALREALVDYYSRFGKRALDRRFFIKPNSRAKTLPGA